MKLRFASLVLVLATAGCATATGSDEGGDAGPATNKDAGATNKDSGAPAKKDAGGTTTEDSGVVQPPDDSGAPPDDTTCAAQTTKNACEQCCLTVHPTGYKIYQQQLDDCICTSPGACATECATETCANQPTSPNDACVACVNAALLSTGACYNAVATACQADTDCTALFGTCIPPCETMQ